MHIVSELSLTNVFTSELEKRILTEEWLIGSVVPSLRDLTEEFGVSRSVVNVGITELISRGYLVTTARKHTVVADWKSEGTLAVLNGLLANDLMDERTLSSMFDCRYLIMTDSAFLAAQNRTEADIKRMRALIENEDYSGGAKILAKYDMKLHRAVTVASGNVVYPLILKSFESSIEHLIIKFYSDTRVLDFIRQKHSELVGAIEQGDSEASKKAMKELLQHGRNSREWIRKVDRNGSKIL
ncbi:MAG: FadR family transcriptional regulator [Anaerolineaceae bacterium]|nr:MAG: FadR family transcriptional regulator [Anaerolineaceae bacterium]